MKSNPLISSIYPFLFNSVIEVSKIDDSAYVTNESYSFAKYSTKIYLSPDNMLIFDTKVQAQIALAIS
jgi:hypothetical protein